MTGHSPQPTAPRARLVHTPHSVAVPEGSSLLAALERAGRRDVPVGCRNGGCGVCKVQVLEGDYRCGPMSRRHVAADQQDQGFALACRLYPISDLAFRPAPTPVDDLARSRAISS